MKHIYVAGIFTALSWSVIGQNNTVAGGGSASGAGGSATYSIGQVDYSNAYGASGSMSQGVQQPFEFFKDVGFEEISTITLQLFPNPTSDWIILQSDLSGKEFHYQLIDSNGKLIDSNGIEEKETTITMKNCSEGLYHLVVFENDKSIQSFKIIKH
jgi:hypothetical protein